MSTMTVRRPRPPRQKAFAPKAWSAGERVQWTQRGEKRTGTVWSNPGPVTASAWVIPDEPMPNEGRAIVVRVRAGTGMVEPIAKTYSVYSTQGWQAPWAADAPTTPGWVRTTTIPAVADASWYRRQPESTIVQVCSREDCTPWRGTSVREPAPSVRFFGRYPVLGSVFPSGSQPCNQCTSGFVETMSDTVVAVRMS